MGPENADAIARLQRFGLMGKNVRLTLPGLAVAASLAKSRSQRVALAA